MRLLIAGKRTLYYRELESVPEVILSCPAKVPFPGTFPKSQKKKRSSSSKPSTGLMKKPAAGLKPVNQMLEQLPVCKPPCRLVPSLLSEAYGLATKCSPIEYVYPFNVFTGSLDGYNLQKKQQDVYKRQPYLPGLLHFFTFSC